MIVHTIRENISELAGIAKETIQSKTQRKKKKESKKRKRVVSLSYETTSWVT